MAVRQAGRAATALCCGSLLAALASCTSASTTRPPGERVAASSHPAGTQRRIPGDDPSIQRWFLKVGNAQTAFDNALFRAEQGIAKHMSSMCKPLDQKIQPILSALPRLRNISSPAGSQIANTIEPAFRTFSKTGARCAAGDFAGARALLPTGVRQQADAENTLDEILDGDANLGGNQ